MPKPARKSAASRSQPRRAAARTRELAPAPVVEQPHGGALRVGNPGNRGGPGTPPSAFRERLRGSYWDRLEVLEDIADGIPMEIAEFPLALVLPHAACPKCGGDLQAKDGVGVSITIVGRRSARAKDRIDALDQMAKYGLGTLKEVSVDDVRERVAATIDTIRAQLPDEQAERVVEALRPVWAAA